MVDYEKKYKSLKKLANEIITGVELNYGNYLSPDEKKIRRTEVEEKVQYFIERKISEWVNGTEEKERNVKIILLTMVIELYLQIAKKEQSKTDETCKNCLTKGFILLLQGELSSNNLGKMTEEERLAVAFIFYLQEHFIGFESLKRAAFMHDYSFWQSIFFEQTGEEIDDVYKEFCMSEERKRMVGKNNGSSKKLARI